MRPNIANRYVAELNSERDKFSFLNGLFKGQDVYIIGGGGSLMDFDFERLKGRNVIATNHSYRYIKQRPNILCALDYDFFHHVIKRGEKLHDLADFILAGPASYQTTEKNLYRFWLSREVSLNPWQFFGAHLTGLVALNVAIVTGAERIFLMGFDCKSGLHFYSKEWPHPRDNKEGTYVKSAKHFDQFKKWSSKIWNVGSPETSNITTFQFIGLDKI